jgi:hypothetical protein
MNNIKPEQKKLDALRAELKDIDKKLAEVKVLEKRRRELIGRWGEQGEIMIAEMALEDSNYPAYRQETEHQTGLLIVDIDEKWISMKNSGTQLNAKNITRYKVSNGWRERARSADSAIDAEKAIKIWNKAAR